MAHDNPVDHVPHASIGTVPPRNHTEQERFHLAWERAQNAMGSILCAYYYGTRPEYVEAIAKAAYAVADLERETSPNHKEPRT